MLERWRGSAQGLHSCTNVNIKEALSLVLHGRFLLPCNHRRMPAFPLTDTKEEVTMCAFLKFWKWVEICEFLLAVTEKVQRLSEASKRGQFVKNKGSSHLYLDDPFSNFFLLSIKRQFRTWHSEWGFGIGAGLPIVSTSDSVPTLHCLRGFPSQRQLSWGPGPGVWGSSGPWGTPAVPRWEESQQPIQTGAVPRIPGISSSWPLVFPCIRTH